MTNAIVEFRYGPQSFIIQGKEDELMEKFYDQFFEKIGEEKRNTKITFIYNGIFSVYPEINRDKTFF